MSRSPRLRLASLFVFGFLPLLTVASTSTVADGGARRNVSSLVFPPNAHPYGKSHGEWVAEFWQYALEFPVEGHPFLDTPEYDFAARQSGKVRFWSAPDGPITREVDIPHGTALFLTIRDVEVSSLEEPPFFGATEQEQRERANWFADRIVDVSVTIDGVPVENVEDYRFESPQFSFDAPTPWIFGATGGCGHVGRRRVLHDDQAAAGRHPHDRVQRHVPLRSRRARRLADRTPGPSPLRHHHPERGEGAVNLAPAFAVP